MPLTPTHESTLVLNALEQEELCRLLEQAVQDIRVEKRRTEAPDYRQSMAEEKHLLETLLEKVRQLRH